MPPPVNDERRRRSAPSGVSISCRVGFPLTPCCCARCDDDDGSLLLLLLQSRRGISAAIFERFCSPSILVLGNHSKAER